ncbi:hypothetical protein ACQP2E_23805 [Actinoplanes sp. CA-015351]|uniref:hypothetical protein n=1 Tax=Actinoplanes sp. CA-015351 TaxID=3239897 RepID=UPI003D970FC9
MALPELTRARNGWEMQLATNFLGHFALITGLLEHLTADARIVMVSSGAQLNAGVDFDDPQVGCDRERARTRARPHQSAAAPLGRDDAGQGRHGRDR